MTLRDNLRFKVFKLSKNYKLSSSVILGIYINQMTVYETGALPQPQVCAFATALRFS